MTKTLRETAVAQGLIICVLVIALTSYAPSYYVLLRFIVCGLCAYLAVAAYQEGKSNSAWVFGALVVLFNPLVPVRLSHDVWSDVYIATILLMGLMLWNLFWRNRAPKAAKSNVPQEDDPLASFLGVQKRRVSQDEQSATRECSCCRQVKPTQFAVFAENVSYFYERRERNLEGYFCFPCLTKKFVIFESSTLFGTWWGIVGMMVGPGYLLWNLIEYCRLSYRFASMR